MISTFYRHPGIDRIFSTDPLVNAGDQSAITLNSKSPLIVPVPSAKGNFSHMMHVVTRIALGLPVDATAEEVTAELIRRGHDAIILDDMDDS